MLALIYQPACQRFRAFVGDIAHPETMTATDIKGGWSWKHSDEVADLGFFLTWRAPGVYEVSTEPPLTMKRTRMHHRPPLASRKAR